MNASNFQLLPEWYQQDGILLSWPHDNSDWAPILSEVETAFVEIAYHTCQCEQLVIIHRDPEQRIHIEELLISRGVAMQKIKWLQHYCNDTWCRDFGPITVQQKDTLKALSFQFNGWGGKFDSERDNLANAEMKNSGILKPELEEIEFVLEGGSIETDGLGTLLTTEACLLTDTRNPGYSKQQIESLLADKLGLSRFLWLTEGYLSGDDTDSHIDNLARFCNEETIIYCSCSDPNDEHYNSLKKLEAELQSFTQPDGQPYKLVALDIPSAIYDEDKRLPASYINFLILNDRILLPVYNDRNDEIAAEKLAAIFNDKTIISIDCSEVIRQYGSIHCLTMQLPAGSL